MIKDQLYDEYLELTQEEEKEINISTFEEYLEYLHEVGSVYESNSGHLYYTEE